jgi:hypothetical protein
MVNVWCTSFWTSTTAERDEEFDQTDYLLELWEADFAAWFAEPHYSVRPELLKWLKADA